MCMKKYLNIVVLLPITSLTISLFTDFIKPRNVNAQSSFQEEFFINKSTKRENINFSYSHNPHNTNVSVLASSSGSNITPMTVPGGRAFIYSLSTVGTTYSGNTNFPTQNTSYTPAFNFRLPGALVIESTLAAQNTDRRNGVNPREVGLFIGNNDALTTAGSLRYGTHTWVHWYWGSRILGRPALDTAFVSLNNITSTLNVRVDPQWARNDTTNLFSWRSSLFSTPRQIIAGDVVIRFINGGRNVTGSATFFGNGYIEPGAYAYVVNFTGTLAR